ncbi:putative glycosyltransferase YwdF [Alicyclobacillus contaminans]|uniref:glycosyltransferase family 2 protein n=1 Tax=Alicyclobacillus contaminans TaxID=392016 RepID=UPI0004255EE4|nr:glycosyltransferase [Alicyclobacillus contaminans]GMA49601.1 putative glycosyltransferase YwdF [Alicyclobacillus contaminans]
MPSVSVLVCTYNRLQDLALCLNAVANQADSVDLEICVVNDGGEPIDPVVRRIRGVPVRYTNLVRNYGQVEARNQALEMATGRWIAICDDDDRWLPGHLERLTRALANHPAAAVAYTDAEIVQLHLADGTARVTGRRFFAWRSADRLLRQYNPVVPSSVLYPRSLHRTLGGFDPAVSHYWDWDWLLRSAQTGSLVRVPVADTLYAYVGEGVNQSANPAVMAAVLDKFCQKHELGALPVSNFLRMTEDPALIAHRASTARLWDGDTAGWWT